MLVHQGRKLAVIEAKSDQEEVGEGVAQAKNYAGKLHLDYTYASNGKQIYQICMATGTEGLVTAFPAPTVLWNKIFSNQNEWRDKFNQVPFELAGDVQSIRYYEEIAVNKVSKGRSKTASCISNRILIKSSKSWNGKPNG